MVPQHMFQRISANKGKTGITAFMQNLPLLPATINSEEVQNG